MPIYPWLFSWLFLLAGFSWGLFPWTTVVLASESTAASSVILARSNPIDLPDFGDEADVVLSPQQEIFLGQAIMRDIKARHLMVTDLAITYPIEQLGAQLVAHLDPSRTRLTYHFFILNDPSVNAFALPGGYIGIHTGLIQATESIGELASVLAHEISHVHQRHIARMLSHLKKVELSAIGAMLGTLLIASQHPEIASGALTASVAGMQQAAINFTRQHESEADRIAISLLAKSGYNPHDMVRFFERLQQTARYEDNDTPAFLKTHPLNSQRIADALSRAEHYPVPPPQDPMPFALMKINLESFLEKNPTLLLRRYESNASHESSPTLKETYGYTLALSRTPQREKAWEKLQVALEHQPHLLDLWLLAIRIQQDLKRTDAAWELFQKAEKRFGPILPLIYPGVQMALDRNEPLFAEQLAKTWVKKHPQQHPEIRLLLSQAHARLHRPVDAYMTRADYFLAEDDWDQALMQIKTALNLEKQSDYEKARLRAKLKQIQARMQLAKENS